MYGEQDARREQSRYGELTHATELDQRRTAEAFRELLTPLRLGGSFASERSLVEYLGRIVWSTVAEPGDGEAGMLVLALGPECALRLTAGQEQSVARDLAASVGEPVDLAKAFGRWRPRWQLGRVEQLCRAASRLGMKFVVPGDAAWPSQLDDLGVHSPHGIWLRGNADALRACTRSIALVGSRASSSYGDHVTGELAAGAVDGGLAVVSGGAYGIDAQAHRSALASDGLTVAVLAGGGDRLYPAGNRELLERTVATGAVITEVPCGQAPTRWRFLQRNRLISALSQATVIVEAGARSGALNTANHALQLGRPLGAVPGPITSASSVGTHRLIREQQAELVTSTEHIFELWRQGARQLPTDTTATDSIAVPLFEDLSSAPAPMGTPAPLEHGPSYSSRAVRVWDALRPRKAQTIAELTQISGMTANDVRAGLIELQLADRAIDNERGWRKLGSL